MPLRLLILTLLAMSCFSLRAEQLTDSVRVHFRVNQMVIDTMLMGNDDAMHGFAQRIQAVSSNDSTTFTVKSMRITGAASPEGSIAVNEHLSRERATAITRWLKSYFEFSDSLPQYVFKGRDWQGLLRMVENDANVPYRNEVIAILRKIANSPSTGVYARNGVKTLKRLRSGVPYYYMWRTMFPALRASEIFIEAELEPKAVEAPMAVAADKPQMVEPIAAAETDVVEAADSIGGPQQGDMPQNIGGYIFGVKTNGLYDLCATPNVGVEFPIGKNWSVGANWMYAWWKNHNRNRHWRIYGGDINARYYFGNRADRPLTGHHVGVYAQVLVFQIAFGGKGYITGIPGENLWGKPYVGGGIEYGYSKQLAQRLNIDFSLGVGYMTGEYRKYRPIDGHYVWQSSHRCNWFGPTKAEISLVWLIGKMQKGGAR